MAKRSLFWRLKRYKFIFVTGPHRSGTSVASHMIAQDKGLCVYYEEHFKFNTKFSDAPGPPEIDYFIKRHYAKESDMQMEYHVHTDGFVVQCPNLCFIAHRWAGIKDLAVVMMVRPVEDIIASQERVQWGFEAMEKKKYDAEGSPQPIAEIKYHYWKTVQKKLLGKQGIEIKYNNLSVHPLWVPKEQRANFHTRQVFIDRPRGERIQLIK